MPGEIDPDENGQDSALVRQLRQQIKTLQGERDTYATQVRTSTFKEAGIDPSAGLGQLFANAYQGELNVDAIRTAATELGLPAAQGQQQPLGQPPPPSDRMQAQQRVEQLQQTGTVDSGSRVSLTDWKALLQGGPADRQRAAELRAQGRVDLPPHLAHALNPTGD